MPWVAERQRSGWVARTFLLIAGAVVMTMPVRAERIEAPLEMLHDPVNLLVAGKAVEIDAAAARVVFEFKTLLAGNKSFVTQDMIEVRVPADALARVTVGAAYIFGYTLFSQDPHRPGKLIGNRQGATLLASPGLEPALFPDTAEVRKLLDAGKSERSRASRSTLDLLLATLKGKDAALQNLAANQIALEQDLRSKLNPADRHTIRLFVADADSSPLARMPLLEAAAQHPEVFGPGWALDATNTLLSTTPVDSFNDKTSDLETLLRVAFSLSAEHPTALPEESLVRWVRSDSVVLAEPALRLLHQQYPVAERPAVEKALQDPDTPMRTKEFLRGYLRRMGDAHGPADSLK